MTEIRSKGRIFAEGPRFRGFVGSQKKARSLFEDGPSLRAGAGLGQVRGPQKPAETARDEKTLVGLCYRSALTCAAKLCRSRSSDAFNNSESKTTLAVRGLQV